MSHPVIPIRTPLPSPKPESLPSLFQRLGIRSDRTEELPFSENDLTGGSEAELQVAVLGDGSQVELPRSIRISRYFTNVLKRSERGEIPGSTARALESYLASNSEQVWENSWVRFPLERLSLFAREVLDRDLRLDRWDPESPQREDAQRFFGLEHGTQVLKLPVSYLLKLAFADALGSAPSDLRAYARPLLEHFSNDNTSPETLSTHVVRMRAQEGCGKALARENLRRYLLTQFLIQYANKKLGLEESGQKAIIYYSPNPPIRQKRLNDCISDSFYRELFMSPCLSGWKRGQDKHAYMSLCHEVLSRSQLHAVAKMRETGIIHTNLVLLPSLSNTSLANNGTHLSLGSLSLSQAASSGIMSLGEEKYLGDLMTKIVEHFLPLMVGTFSAAPSRIAFEDFHPERILGFLPHELDFTHLRQIWRQWKAKAHIRVLGHPLTPFGPMALDHVLAQVLGLRGDWVPDQRLLDYLVALLSTDESPALDGHLGNGDQLKRDLADMGIFDPRMPMYMLFRQRLFSFSGFSGFEGRTYSLFEDLQGDFAHAATLQALFSAFAFREILSGAVSHEAIPDTPFTESERRLPFFASAMGLSEIYFRKDNSNSFLKRILARCPVSESRRYPESLKCSLRDYQLGLIHLLREEAPELIENLGAEESLAYLSAIIQDPALGAASRLCRAVTGGKSPMGMGSEDFNQSMEIYLRDTLRKKHLRQGMELFKEECLSDPETTGLFLEGRDPQSFIEGLLPELMEEKLLPEILVQLIHLLLVCCRRDAQRQELPEKTLAAVVGL